MSVSFSGFGRVGVDPEQRTIGTGEDAKPLVRLRVYFEGSVKSGDEYVDKYGFWSDVEIWRPGLGRQVAKHVRKGMLVLVDGTLRCKSFEKNGETKESFEVRAEKVTLGLVGIEAITMAPKAPAQSDEETQDAA